MAQERAGAGGRVRGGDRGRDRRQGEGQGQGQEQEAGTGITQVVLVGASQPDRLLVTRPSPRVARFGFLGRSTWLGFRRRHR